MRETAFAKVNLALHVRSRHSDGYHAIETLFAFAEQGDELAVASSDDLTLSITGPFAAALDAGPDNLVLRAAEALRAASDVPKGAALTLDKRLPVASGIGGGSADAGAALRLLRRFWSVDVDDKALHAIAAGLGADVPACLHSRTAIGTGRGDRLSPVEPKGLAGTPILLVNPDVAVSTAAVFGAWDGRDRGPFGDYRDGRNDLEAPARRIAPAIGDVLDLLGPDAELARMSGSGATCFALYPDEAARDAADARIAALRPGWWRLATRLR